MKIHNLKIFSQDSFLLLLVVVLVFWDLGDPDALRQGTEGFYFSITKEMFANKSFLIPLHDSSPHWSKPPLQFWISYLFYLVSGGQSLLLARLSVALTSLLGLSYISSWLTKFSKIKPQVIMIYFLSALGVLKYSRIFMLEIPLALTTFITVLLYFDFLQTKKKKKLIASSFVLALSILVKGPVSFVMATSSIMLFYVISKNNIKTFWKDFVLWCLISLGLGSLWYFYCYLQFGKEFIDYFFLRENLGKFSSSRTYSISVLFQGLIIFSLPWFLFLIAPIKKLFKHRIKLQPHHLFLLCSFLTFFIIWMIPSQRSHHYAFPAVFPLLSLILLLIFDHYKLFKKEILITQKIILIFPLILLGLLLTSFFIKIPHLNHFNYLKISFFILLLSLTCFALWKAESFKSLCLCAVFTLALFWNFIAPTFILPKLPTKAEAIIGKKEVITYYRKKAFIEEILQRSIIHKSKDKFLTYLNTQSKDAFIIVKEDFFKENDMNQNFNILLKWYTWKKRTKFKEILHALLQQNLSSLQEANLLTVKN